MDQSPVHTPAFHAVPARGFSWSLASTTSRTAGVIVVYLSGAILFGEESASLLILVKELVEQIPPKSCSISGNVTHFDSGSVGNSRGCVRLGSEGSAVTSSQRAIGLGHWLHFFSASLAAMWLGRALAREIQRSKNWWTAALPLNSLSSSPWRLGPGLHGIAGRGAGAGPSPQLIPSRVLLSESVLPPRDSLTSSLQPLGKGVVLPLLFFADHRAGSHGGGPVLAQPFRLAQRYQRLRLCGPTANHRAGRQTLRPPPS